MLRRLYSQEDGVEVKSESESSSGGSDSSSGSSDSEDSSDSSSDSSSQTSSPSTSQIGRKTKRKHNQSSGTNSSSDSSIESESSSSTSSPSSPSADRVPPSKYRKLTQVTHRVPISRNGERPAKEFERFTWGRSIRTFLWIHVLRNTPTTLIAQFYDGVLSPAQINIRLKQRIRDYKKELLHVNSKVVTGKVLDDASEDEKILSFQLYYIPSNQGKDLQFWIADTRSEYITINRNEALSDELVMGVIHDLTLQGISACRIAELFQVDGFYHKLFGAFESDEEPISRPVLKYLKQIYQKQKNGYESLLQACIDEMIQHAPTPEIGQRLLEYAQRNKLKSSGGRYLTAGINWYKTWKMVWDSMSDDERKQLKQVEKLVSIAKARAGSRV